MDTHEVKHLFGLIGYPLGHSFSGRYFSEKFAREGFHHCRYELFPIPTIEALPDLLAQHAHLRGLNVTIPYKEQVLAFAQAGEPAVESLGAANTLVVDSSGQLWAYNTDVIGFERSLCAWLHELGVSESDFDQIQALILGTGGAAKAVSFVLRQLRISYRMVSRSATRGELIYEELTPALLQRVQLIVNTTPLGMAPHVTTIPSLPMEAIGCSHMIFDLVYNPEKTRLLAEAQQRGAHVKNGLEMLYLQAEQSWNIWRAHHRIEPLAQ